MGEKGRANFVGGLVVDEEDVDGLVKGILPIPELRRQVEAAIGGAVDYLNKEKDPATGEPIQVPDFFIRLRPILGTRVPTPAGVIPVEGTAKPVIFAFLKNKLRNNIEFLPPPTGDESQRREVLAQQLDETLNQLQDPVFPIQVPSLVGIPIEDRSQVYDRAIELLSAQDIPLDEIRGLEEAETEIKEKLLTPNPDESLIEALSVAIWPLVEPRIDESFNDFRDEELDQEDRFDPIAKVAENRDDTKEEVLDELDTARDWLNRAKSLGSWVGILVIAFVAILLGLLHLPRQRPFFGWPGLTLLFSGIVFLGVGIVLKSQLPDRLESFLESEGSGCSGVSWR